MKLKHDYKESPKHLEIFGLEQIIEAESVATSTQLLPCPFCNSEAVLVLRWLYTKKFVGIECQSCGVQSRLFFTGYNQLSGRATSISESIVNAANAWNMRAY